MITPYRSSAGRTIYWAFCAAVAALILLALGSDAAAQARRAGGGGGVMIGVNRTFVSGATFTLEDTATPPSASNDDSMLANELFLEWLVFNRVGLELDIGLTELERTYELNSVLGSVEETARPIMLGANLYFKDHGRRGFRGFVGLGTGTVSVDYKFSGGSVGSASSSHSVSVNALKVGLDWQTETAGLRTQLISWIGKLTDTESISGFKQTVDYTATVFTIGVFAIF